MPTSKKDSKSKKPSLFDDDFDRMYADIQNEIAIIDGMAAPKKADPPPKGPSSRPDLPPHGDDNYIWDRNKILQLPESSANMTLPGFVARLRDMACYFVWNDFVEGKPILGWTKEGYALNPVTAYLLFEYKLHYSRCVTDLAAQRIGLSEQDAKLISFACWNDDPRSMARHPDVALLRSEIIAAISEGVRKWKEEQSRS